MTTVLVKPFSSTRRLQRERRQKSRKATGPRGRLFKKRRTGRLSIEAYAALVTMVLSFDEQACKKADHDISEWHFSISKKNNKFFCLSDGSRASFSVTFFPDGMLSLSKKDTQKIRNQKGALRYLKKGDDRPVVCGFCEVDGEWIFCINGRLPVWPEIKELTKDEQALVRGARMLGGCYLM